MRTVLVTGASSGIGYATALEFARAGYRVFATVRGPEGDARLRADAAGLAVEVLRCDVRDLASVRAMVAEVRTVCERLDVLVNNAGYAAAVAVEDIDLDAFWGLFEVNVRGLVAVTKEALPLLGRGSTIVNISSLAGRIAVPLMAAYCGSKFAVEAITDALRMELIPSGIRVVAVEPGPVGRTNFSEKLARVSGPYWDRPSKYARAYEAVRRERSGLGAGAIPAEKVARIVRVAAESKRPRARYATQPGQAVLISLSKAFPRRWIDRAIMGYVGMAADGGKP